MLVAGSPKPRMPNDLARLAFLAPLSQLKYTSFPFERFVIFCDHFPLSPGWRVNSISIWSVGFTILPFGAYWDIGFAV